MGLFGGSKNPEKLIHQEILLMDAKQPKAAISPVSYTHLTLPTKA